jgi:hypothetical protein
MHDFQSSSHAKEADRMKADLEHARLRDQAILPINENS